MSDQMTDAFQALADPGRRAILKMVASQRMPINSIAQQFDISRPAISKHIKILQQAGFINIEEQGRERYCVLNEDGFREINAWITYFEQYWHKQLSTLESVLKDRFPKS